MDIGDLLFRIIGILSIPLVLVSVALMIRSLRHEQFLTSSSLIIQLLMSPIILIIYALLLKAPVYHVISIPLFIVGLGIGLRLGQTTRLRYYQKRVLGKRSAWYLAVWGLTFAVTQGLALVASSEATSFGLASMFFATGIAIGINADLLSRHRKLLRRPASDNISCSTCGSLNPASYKSCIHCGASLAIIKPKPSAAKTAPSNVQAFCYQCGAPNSKENKYCYRCGTKLMAD